MMHPVRTRAALLLVLLVALPAMAQEPAAEAGDTPSSAVPEAAGTDGASATIQNGQETGSPADASQGDRAPAPGQSPSDYRPSEQISEDLSVSFPVDI
jgi:hypothetical protein